MALSADIAGRVERLREHFELADNWPTEPFALNAFSWVSDPAEFVDGHLTFLLSVQHDALALPYLLRLEGLLPPAPKTPAKPSPKRVERPPKQQGGNDALDDVREYLHGGKSMQLAFF